MTQRLKDLAAQAANNLGVGFRATCPTCERGGVGLATPTVEDLEALIEIRDGFNDLRRSFTPDVEEKFRRFDNTIGYMHALIVGTKDGGM